MILRTETASKAPDLLTPLGTALITVLGSWRLFEPKFAKARAIKTETGRREPSFWFFYVLPQWILIGAVLVVLALTGAAFFYEYQQDTSRWPPIFRAASEFIRTDNIVVLGVALVALGLVIYSNVISRLLLWSAALMSWLPIPGIRGRFGRSGTSPGWHQTRNVVEGPDKGTPILIDYSQLGRLSTTILARMVANAGTDNFAEEPQGIPSAVKANIALFGCILEEQHYANRWPRRSWRPFYAALVDVQAADSLFEPSNLKAFANGGSFFEALRVSLNNALQARGVPPMENNGLAAADAIASAWRLLTQRAEGSVLRLVPWYAPFLRGKAFSLDQELRAFPGMNSDGMRPQLLKLLLRWNVLDVSERGNFVQPFSKTQAWLLFQEGYLRALPEMKEVTFNGTGEVSICRYAALRLAKAVADLVRAGNSLEAQAVNAAAGSGTWELESGADYSFWSWAREQEAAARAGGWDKNSWSWKLDAGRLTKLA